MATKFWFSNCVFKEFYLAAYILCIINIPASESMLWLISNLVNIISNLGIKGLA